jgi:hypothetical protein
MIECRKMPFFWPIEKQCCSEDTKKNNNRNVPSHKIGANKYGIILEIFHE